MCFGQPYYLPGVPSRLRGIDTYFQDAFCLAPYFSNLVSEYVYYRVYNNALNDIDAAIVDLAKQLVLDVHDVVIEPDVVITATWVNIQPSRFRVQYYYTVLPIIVVYLHCICFSFFRFVLKFYLTLNYR